MIVNLTYVVAASTLGISKEILLLYTLYSKVWKNV